MNAQRLIGAVLLALGAVLLLMGWNASQSVTEDLRETFTGQYSETTTWYFIGGAVSAVAGILLMAFGGRATRTA